MALYIALKDLKVFIRDTKALLIIFLMPLILIFIIGSSLQNQFSKDAGVKKFIVGIANKDGGIISNILVNQVLRGNMDDMLDVYILEQNELIQKVNEKKIPVGIIIPAGFSKGMEIGAVPEVKIMALPEEGFRGSIIKAIISSYVDTVGRNYSMASNVKKIMDENNKSISKPFDGISDLTAILMELNRNNENNKIDFTLSEKSKSKSISSMQYYSVSMMVMYVLFCANISSRFLIMERENSTLARLMVSANKRVSVLMGKMLGSFIMCFLAGTVLILFTKYIYSVNWGESIGAVVITLISLSVVAAGFGVFIAAVAKTSSASANLGAIIIQVSTLLSGGMIPIYIMPDFLKKVAMVTPNYWASSSFYTIMNGSDAMEILSYSLILLAIGGVLSGLGIWKFKTT